MWKEEKTSYFNPILTIILGSVFILGSLAPLAYFRFFYDIHFTQIGDILLLKR